MEPKTLAITTFQIFTWSYPHAGGRHLWKTMWKTDSVCLCKRVHNIAKNEQAFGLFLFHLRKNRFLKTSRNYGLTTTTGHTENRTDRLLEEDDLCREVIHK